MRCSRNNMTKAQEKVIKEMPQTGFHFNDEVHLYILDGKPLTGVTTILQVIAKPALIQWSADEAVKYLGWFNEKYCTDKEKALEEFSEKWTHEISKLGGSEFYQMLCDARIQHAKRKKDAGTVGTDVHAEIEKYVKLMISDQGGQAMAMNGYDNEMVKKFVEWAVENKIKFLESEKRVYSKENWYAGTCDLVLEKDGKKFVGDIKTSSGIYGREYFFQMAGYQIALEEMGEKDFFGSTVIRCGKDGSFEVKDSFDLESDKAGFLAALKLYREINK